MVEDVEDKLYKLVTMTGISNGDTGMLLPLIEMISNLYNRA